MESNQNPDRSVNRSSARPLLVLLLAVFFLQADDAAILAIESTYRISNSILWDSSPNEISSFDAQMTVTSSDVQGGFAGEGNIDQAPLFVAQASGDFHLNKGSPCIDRGNNNAPGVMSIDKDGKPRILNGTVDMRPHEADGTTATITAAFQLTLNDGLVASYPFNGNADDASGNGNNGAVNGAILTTDRFGNENSAYRFDGESSYISVPANPMLEPETITAAVWVQYSGEEGGELRMIMDSSHAVLGYPSGWVIQYRGDMSPHNLNAGYGFISKDCDSDSCDLDWGEANANSESEVADGKWHFIVFTMNPSHELTLYVDGSPKISTGYSIGGAALKNMSPVPTGGLIEIGAMIYRNERYFKGKIDDIRIYNRPLTDREVLALYGVEPIRYVDNQDGTVTDNQTKLIWQQADDGMLMTQEAAAQHCEALVLGGHDDWRLPRIDELESLVDYTTSSPPAIDQVFDGGIGRYWSSTGHAKTSLNVGWLVNFEEGLPGAGYRAQDYYVRCVRNGPFWSLDPYGDPSGLPGHLEPSGENGVRDTCRDRVWQKNDDGQRRTWQEAQSYCDNLELDGSSEWRLPTTEELLTIVDYTTYYPALSTEIFKGLTENYWAAPYPMSPGFAVYVNFTYGDVHWMNEIERNFVRCVRAEFGDLSTLSVHKTGSGTGRVTSTPPGIDCGATCSASIPAGTEVTLCAAADSGSIFSGWSGGGCSGVGSCTFLVSENMTVVAAFTLPTYTLSGTVTVAGGGPLAGVTLSLTGPAPAVTVTNEDGGYCFSGLSPGVYRLSAGKDAYEFTPSVREVNIGNSDLTGQDFTATLVTGALTVTLSPEDVVSLGAQWRLDGKDWLNSGDTLNAVAVGQYLLEFKQLPNWSKPANQTVTIAKGQTTAAAGLYSMSLCALRATITPDAAVAAGAQWRVNFGEWKNSGETVWGLLPEVNYYLDFKEIEGWNAPPAISDFTHAPEIISVVRSYQRQTGKVLILISPGDAGNAGARWRLDGGAWNRSGVEVETWVGSHALEFKDVVGYLTPAPTTITVENGKTAFRYGDYVRCGALTVALRPLTAIGPAAQWRVDGGDWKRSGEIVRNLAPGGHTVEFNEAAGWIKPENLGVSVTSGRTAKASGRYVRQTGSLEVVISPQEVVAAGAKWRADGGKWQNSGASETALSVGRHTVDYLSVYGWITPARQNVAVAGGAGTSVTGEYGQETGVLAVVIVPAAAVAEGAQWRVDGGAWRSGGELDRGIAFGQHTVEFTPVAGRNTPQAQNVVIVGKKPLVAVGEYLKPGVPLVSIKTAVAEASESGTVAAQVNIEAKGAVTISPLPVFCWLGGSATNGVDYQRLVVGSWGETVSYVYRRENCYYDYTHRYVCKPPYYQPVPIYVRPLNDSQQEGPETVTFGLTASSDYEIGYPYSATVTVKDDD